MSSNEGESRGRRSRRVAAQQNESGKEGIPAKKDMTVEELKRYGERTASSSHDDSSGSTTYQYS